MKQVCPTCHHAELSVYTTRIDEDAGYRIRYLKCDYCRETTKTIIPLEYAPSRRDRAKSVAEKIKNRRKK